MNRQSLCYLLVLLCSVGWLAVSPAIAQQRDGRPNVIILFCDDLGYGDLGCYGHPVIRTPQIDRMAKEGVRFTQFYTVAAVCSPARASLLTGRYPPKHGTLGIYAHHLSTGMDLRELTLAQLLAQREYRSTCIGKWHLGHDSQFLPRNRGFDSYYGVPYSNDMQIDPEMAFAPDAVFRDGWTLEKVRALSFTGPNKPQRELVPLMLNEQVIEYPTDQRLLTYRYTQRALTFIKENRENPFFLYLAYTMPHVPLFASEPFEGESRRGLYGDCVEEIDWSVGRILADLKKYDLAKNSFVFFTSDNGPWLTFKWDGGSAGPLRGGKFTTWEGGMRVPGIAWWPDKIKPAVTSQLATTMDLFTTALQLAGAQQPTDRVIDGVDLSDLLLSDGKSPRVDMAYYRRDELQAYRLGEWKVHFRVQPDTGGKPGPWLNEPQLYNLEEDPGERYDVASKYPKVLEELVTRARAFKKP